MNEMKFVHMINPNIFGQKTTKVYLKHCKCGALMEWYDKWICPHC